MEDIYIDNGCLLWGVIPTQTQSVFSSRRFSHKHCFGGEVCCIFFEMSKKRPLSEMYGSGVGDHIFWSRGVELWRFGIYS